MSAKQHSPKQIEVFGRPAWPSSFKNSSSPILSVLEELSVNDWGSLNSDGLSDYLVRVVEVADVYGIAQDQLD